MWGLVIRHQFDGKPLDQLPLALILEHEQMGGLNAGTAHALDGVIERVDEVDACLRWRYTGWVAPSPRRPIVFGQPYRATQFAGHANHWRDAFMARKIAGFHTHFENLARGHLPRVTVARPKDPTLRFFRDRRPL